MKKYLSKELAPWLLVAVLTVMLFLAYSNHRSLVSCVNNYIQEAATVSATRAAVAERNDQAVEDMVDGVLSGATSEERRKALEKYKEVRNQVREERDRNPVPEAPQHC